MKLHKACHRNLWLAHLHAGAKRSIQHPFRNLNDFARPNLYPHDRAAGPILTTFVPKTTTLAPGSGKTMKAWLWAYARDDRPYGGTSPPMVTYRFEDSRGAQCVARPLVGLIGILQVDGYMAYTSLARTRAKGGNNETIQLAGCWAHLRRKFYDLHITGVSQAATDMVVAMSALWKVEDEVRGRDVETRATLRQQKSAVIVTGLFDLWERELRKISGNSKTAETIRYALSWRDVLEQFLADGRVEIDSNIVERAIRPQTITRKIVYSPAAKVVDAPGRHWPLSFRPVGVDGPQIGIDVPE
ncbi:transposase IS66 family [Shinella sp. DD12]|jgi:transposase|nr:transposase IS66 family [Shinella sp. DD12]